MQIDEQILLLFEGAMGFHCNREKTKKMPYMCFTKNIELNLNSFSTPSESDPYPQPLSVRCSSSVPSLYLRSAFALPSLPEADKKRPRKGSTPKQPRPKNPPISRRPTVTRYSVTVQKTFPLLPKNPMRLRVLWPFRLGSCCRYCLRTIRARC